MGTIFCFIGILGIFIPGLPATPFFLLSAYFYLKSSAKLYKFLLSNKYISSYILNYRRYKGITLLQKLYSIVLMWTMIVLSSIFFIKNKFIITLVILLGIIGTIIMGFILKTIKK